MPLGYVLRRLALALPVLAGVVTIAFFATIAAPGDPLAGLLPENPTPEQYEQAQREFGLDQTPLQQWLRYLERTATGDLGRSLRTRREVVDDLRVAGVATLELALVAFVLTSVFGVVLGVLSAVRHGRLLDKVIGVISLGGVAAPIFWTAIIVQLIFYATLHWLPAGGRIDDLILLFSPFPTRTGSYLIDSLLALNVPAFISVLAHLVLPASVLAYRAMALVIRVTRSAMLDTLFAPYIQTARAFGARERRIVLLHALRNALPPILTVLGLAFGELLTGSLLVESVFGWPGLGLYTFQSIVALDYPGIIGVSLAITTIYVVVNLLVDLAYPLADPRLRATAR